MTTSPPNIPELVALAKKAGVQILRRSHWTGDDESLVVMADGRDRIYVRWPGGTYRSQTEDLAAFIAAASPAVVLALCEKAEEARELLEQIRKWGINSAGYDASACRLHTKLADEFIAALRQPSEAEDA